MAWPLQNQLYKAIQVTGISVTELPSDESRAVRQLVSSIYAKGTASLFLWEYFSNSALVTNANAWLWVSDYVGDNPCLLFFFEHLAPPVFGLDNGFDVVALLGGLSMEEFYLTNDKASYLLCFSHHDILYAVGNAKTWLEQRVSEISNRF